MHLPESNLHLSETSKDAHGPLITYRSVAERERALAGHALARKQHHHIGFLRLPGPRRCSWGRNEQSPSAQSAKDAEAALAGSGAEAVIEGGDRCAAGLLGGYRSVG
jgi:hypothetical protein